MIVDTIGTIDDLIEKYGKITSNLRKLSTLLYEEYKSKKFDSNLELGSCCDIKTGKLNADESSEEGIYPFFTCGKDILKINSYAFDGDLIVVSSNGEISVKYYYGKCNAYQRTYMLHPSKYFFLFLKEIESKVEELTNNSQGSVIKFITKGMLSNISIRVNDESNNINLRLADIYKKVTNYEKTIEKLKSTKSALLAKYF